MKIRSTIAALAAGALVTAATALTAPVASAASPPQQKTMKLSDNCDRPSWEATPGFQGACNVDAGGVTPDRFNADLPKGGNNNWWINNREETIKEGDSLFVDNVGGEVHTFTRVDQFGQGVVPPFNAAVPNDPPASGGEIVANPVADSTSATAPDHMEVMLDEELQPGRVQMGVSPDTTDVPVPLPPLQIDGNVAIQPLPALAAGAYTAGFRVLARDGHVYQRTFHFTVGAGGATAPGHSWLPGGVGAALTLPALAALVIRVRRRHFVATAAGPPRTGRPRAGR
jgi:methionine-rich copper-binding protein CopC